jgi:alpha-ketoglutarate-dependent taurine dioxygenase
MIITRVDSTLGAVITGVRLADLDDAAWHEIEAAFNEHAVLIFPDQHLTGEEQEAFALRFGPLEFSAAITNVTKEGDVLPPDDTTMSILRGNEGWHTDSSYMPLAAKASMLTARVVPPGGAPTEWADMRAAYDALDDATKAKIADLDAAHSIVYSQQRVGLTMQDNDYGKHGGPDPRRPLVKIHPATGRPSLFIGRHAHALPGMSDAESEAFLDGLLAEACQPPRTHTHEWTPGDLVVWDNRCVLHRVRPWDWREPRVLKHSRVKGDPATEAALN